VKGLIFALCHPPSKPVIFIDIDVNQPGSAEDAAVRQALKYAFHSGVPFIVLRDGSRSPRG
jgi:predicted type IV restriction endonuclease